MQEHFENLTWTGTPHLSITTLSLVISLEFVAEEHKLDVVPWVLSM